MVFPIHDENPTRHPPYLTLLLIGFNVVIFLFSPGVHTSVAGNASDRVLCQEQAYFDRWGAVPAELTHNQSLPYTAGPPVGPNQCVAVPPSYHKVPALSALTALFVHAGWLHLIGNMLFLWVFGNNVEDRFGRLRFAVFYLVVGVAATYAYAYTTADTTGTLVGASGAIAGVLGAYVMMFPRARVLTVVIVIPLWLRAWVVLGVWFVLQAVNAQLSAETPTSGGIGYLVHVVGFVLGLGYGLWFRGRHPPPHPLAAPRRPPPPRWRLPR